MTVQYGEGYFDHAHLELTPLSTAGVGVYIPLPRTDKLALLKYERASGLDIDISEVGE